MIAAILFEAPAAWWLGLPLAAVFGFGIWRNVRARMPVNRIVILGGLRAVLLLLLLFLAARPVWIAKTPAASGTRSLVLLLDRSESMSLQEPETSRYHQALDFVRDRLQPALKSSGMPVQAMLFD